MSEKTNNFLDSFLQKVAAFTSIPQVVAIKDGILLIMPATLLGSIFLLLAFFPVPGYEAFVTSIVGEGWQQKVLYPVGATFDMMGLLVVIAVSYKLAGQYKLDALGASLVALMSFMLLTPFEIKDHSGDILTGIPVALLGTQGIFVAMITALISTEIYKFAIVKNWTIKMPANVPEGVSRSFSVLIPGFMAILFFWLLRLGIESLGIESAHDIVRTLLAKPLSNVTNSLGGALIYTFFVHFLWSFGVHGSALTETIFSPIMLQLLDENRLAYQAGEALPNIVTKPFYDAFVTLGGVGSTLPLVIAMIIFARSAHLKSVGKVSLMPGVFQINEPVTFGVPIVLNPIMIIPFILIPMVLTITSYSAMYWGLLPKPTGVMIPWTTPIFISGYLMTGGSLLGVLWQVINFTIATLIWLPFFKIIDRMEKLKESA